MENLRSQQNHFPSIYQIPNRFFLASTSRRSCAVSGASKQQMCIVVVWLMVWGLVCGWYQSGGWVGRKSTSVNKLTKRGLLFHFFRVNVFFLCSFTFLFLLPFFFVILLAGKKNGNCILTNHFMINVVGYGLESTFNDLTRQLFLYGETCRSGLYLELQSEASLVALLGHVSTSGYSIKLTTDVH